MQCWNVENWDNYLESFRANFTALNSTDPSRFPTDDRDGNGFWQTQFLTNIWGEFSCSRTGDEDGVECQNRWASKQVLVELKFRYNQAERRGEVVVSREMRQRCSQHRRRVGVAGDLGQGWSWPQLSKETTDWIMYKLVGRIRRVYYEEGTAKSRNSSGRGQYWLPREPDHHYSDCEACIMGSCGRRGKEDRHHLRKGRDFSQTGQLEHIKWVLLDENNHAFDLV